MWTSSSPTAPILPVSAEHTLTLGALTNQRTLVPMEEVVRAFNWVIEKGWVSLSILGLLLVKLTSDTGILLGHFRMERPRNRGGVPRRTQAQLDPADC